MTLELIMVLPVLLIVLLAMVELGSYMLAAQAIQAAAMAGAERRPCPAPPMIASGRRLWRRWRDGLMPPRWGRRTFRSPTALPEGSVSVSVSVEASKAALNPLAMVPGLDLTGKRIAAQFVMRKE